VGWTAKGYTKQYISSDYTQKTIPTAELAGSTKARYWTISNDNIVFYIQPILLNYESSVLCILSSVGESCQTQNKRWKRRKKFLRRKGNKRI